MDNFVPGGSLKRFNPFETGVDELTCSTLLKCCMKQSNPVPPASNWTE
jgi:hypothetical protein